MFSFRDMTIGKVVCIFPQEEEGRVPLVVIATLRQLKNMSQIDVCDIDLTISLPV